jgi:glycosidase
MATQVFSTEITDYLKAVQEAAKTPSLLSVPVDNQLREVPYPFPSPADWRDCWVYFLMIDRFNNPAAVPRSTLLNPPVAWNQKFDFRQGGTFRGVQMQLPYLEELGVKALWLSPVLKNAEPAHWSYNYTDYAIQDFLNVDARFASDGNLATAERELTELIQEAHARGIYIIFDIVINHTARVFDYLWNGNVVDSLKDATLMGVPLGQEPTIQWLEASGSPRADWQDQIPPTDGQQPGDGIYPLEFRRADFFRRRGEKLSDYLDASTPYIQGDFGTMRQFVAEYDAESQADLRQAYGSKPVLNALIHIHQYLLAKYDIDGYRIDTVKYVAPEMVEIFGNAIREYAFSIGKKNFFTFGEIYDNESNIASFVGRNSTTVEGFGIDAALDFPLFHRLPEVVKGDKGVEEIRNIFFERRQQEKELVSSHGEAGRYFVSFLDNHDQHHRFNHPSTPVEQVTMGLALLFCLQGIPCLYYGTEQGLNGTVNANGAAELNSFESVREALWGKSPSAFDTHHGLYQQIKQLARLRNQEFALRYGRLYFREVSGNGSDFGLPSGKGGIVAFSRILTNREIVVVANMSSSDSFEGYVLVDRDLNRPGQIKEVAYSNLDTTESQAIQTRKEANFYEGKVFKGTGNAALLPISLQPREVQVWR